ncbi:MAG: DUF4105 domain-containing protein [Pseudomonadota bacterium]
MHPFIIAVVLFTLSAPAWASVQSAYLTELQSRARELHLDRHPQWRSLLHYQPNLLLAGVTSTVDSQNFFIAAEGKTNPAAELDATLASFFNAEPRDGEPTQCRVKARYEWLKTLLHFDPQRLPEQACERYQAWLKAIDPAALAMIFASSEISSPASMFGHTLMRLEGRGHEPGQKLLANAINYAAVYDESESSMLYAARGIAGGYVGVFTMSPYYEKVNEYARIESRDLWEYPLLLAADELQRLLWHLWEMREVEFNYYFFDENCSYQLLSLLDVARPDLRLLEAFPRPLYPHVIPLDTVRELQRAGLLGAPVFRAALANRLQHSLSQLTPPQYRWVLDYAAGDAELDDAVLTQADIARQAALLDAAHDYLYYLYRNEVIERGIGLPRAQQALQARSRLHQKSDLVPLPPPEFSPEQAHGSARLSAGLRADRRGTALLLRSRDALHDLLDPPRAYLTGGQIEFFDLGLLLNDDGLRVQELKLAGVKSVAPWNRAFKPWSWFASFGGRRYGLDLFAAKPLGSLGFYSEGGGGITFAPAQNLQLFVYGEAQLDVNPVLRDHHSIALGPRIGAAWQWARHWTHLSEAQWLTPVAGGGDRQTLLRSGFQWQWTQRLGLRASFNYARSQGASLSGSDVLIHYYF